MQCPARRLPGVAAKGDRDDTPAAPDKAAGSVGQQGAGDQSDGDGLAAGTAKEAGKRDEEHGPDDEEDGEEHGGQAEAQLQVCVGGGPGARGGTGYQPVAAWHVD